MTPDFEHQRVFKRTAMDFSAFCYDDFLAYLMNIYSIYVYYLVDMQGRTARQT
jgi:hypothetical protein